MGHTLLGFSEKEVGRMTVRKLLKLYDHYKKQFDLEMVLKQKGWTYTKLAEVQMKEEEWL